MLYPFGRNEHRAVGEQVVAETLAQCVRAVGHRKNPRFGSACSAQDGNPRSQARVLPVPAPGNPSSGPLVRDNPRWLAVEVASLARR